jgi:c(7)-type cytochrome triheme protein
MTCRQSTLESATLYRIITLITIFMIASQSAFAESKTYQIDGEVVPFAKDGIHDPENDAIGVYQHPQTALKGFPRDTVGVIDWAKAMDKGMLIGRANVEGTAEMEVLELDIIRKNTGEMPYVKFPHRQHSLQMACDSCHTGMFEKKTGATPINMSDILAGNKCGVCHGKVAFPPTNNCMRCHSQPK